MDTKYFNDVLGLQTGTSATSCGSEVIYYHRHLDTSTTKPIVVLIHGYPQSSFMWRHVISRLPTDIPLFVPDIPGYGQSTPSQTSHDKRTIGNAILEALEANLIGQEKKDVVLVGHDRGARICHRLAVDDGKDFERVRIVGTILLDIVPTKVQFESFANSEVAIGSFHWLLMANVELATPMIQAFGGGKYCKYLIERWAGSSSSGLDSLKRDDSMDVYMKYFEKESVVRASCQEYGAGAKEDVQEQEKDQEMGKRIKCKTMVLYSRDYLGSRFDIRKIWEKWVDESSELQVEGVERVGHFLAEEEPEFTTGHILKFLEKLRRN